MIIFRRTKQNDYFQLSNLNPHSIIERFLTDKSSYIYIAIFFTFIPNSFLICVHFFPVDCLKRRSDFSHFSALLFLLISKTLTFPRTSARREGEFLPTLSCHSVEEFGFVSQQMCLREMLFIRLAYQYPKKLIISALVWPMWKSVRPNAWQVTHKRVEYRTYAGMLHVTSLRSSVSLAKSVSI